MKRNQTYSTVMIIVTLLAAILLIDSGAIYAQGEMSLENYATGFCLDSNTKRQVYTLRCNDGNFQDWIALYNKEDKTFTLKDDATGFCLDSNTKRQVYTLKCNGGSFQRWYLIPHRDSGTFTFRNLATRFCLDSNFRENVYTLKCNGGNYQNWKPR